jgi:hypothetical protein
MHKLAGAADTEAVVGSFGLLPDLDGVLVYDFLVRLGIAGPVGHVPAEGLEQGIEELLPELGFVVLAGFVVVAVPLEVFDESEDFRRARDGPFPALLGCAHGKKRLL